MCAFVKPKNVSITAVTYVCTWSRVFRTFPPQDFMGYFLGFLLHAGVCTVCRWWWNWLFTLHGKTKSLYIRASYVCVCVFDIPRGARLSGLNGLWSADVENGRFNRIGKIDGRTLNTLVNFFAFYTSKFFLPFPPPLNAFTGSVFLLPRLPVDMYAFFCVV